jgi:hypothetical protein
MCKTVREFEPQLRHVVLREKSLAAIQSMEADLHASASLISLSISLFVAIQGSAPLVWAALSEIKGRKVCGIVAPFGPYTDR